MKCAKGVQRVLAIIFTPMILGGCTNHSEIIRETEIITNPPVQIEGETIFNYRTVYGVAIGVSFYGPSASTDFPSMPAHALSAGMMIDNLDRTYTHRRGSVQGGLRLVTDLRLKVGDPANLGILNRLATAIGVDSINKYDSLIFRGATPNRDGTWPYFGNNLPISKARIESAIDTSIGEMRERGEKEEIITGLIYVSAHGVLGADKVAYIIPGDAVATNSATWIKVPDLLRPIYEFASEGGNQELKKRIVVILDICQRGGAGGIPIPTPPRGVAVILSASPGQYAWHFISEEKLKEKIQVTNSEPTISAALQSSKMSFLPISLRRSLAEMGAGLPPYEATSEKDLPKYRKHVSVKTIVESLKREMTNLTESDPLVKKNGGQDLAVVYGEAAETMNFLSLLNARNLFKQPREKMDWAVAMEQVQ